MGDVTDLYQIPYITDEDLVGDTPDVDKAQAERIDYLFSVNTGPDGKSAYDVYVESVQPPDTPLSEKDWLESLNGDVGASAYDELLPAHQEPVELANTTFGHLLSHTSHAPLNYYPIGTVIEWGGQRAEQGWLWCDGKAYDYTKPGNKDLGALYGVVGNTYGGSGTLFAVPDKRNHVTGACHHLIYAGGDTSSVTSAWQQPLIPVAEGSAPIGSIELFAGVGEAPTGYLWCDGSEYQIAQYRELAEILGTTYGVSPSGSSYFLVPNLVGRVAIGSGADGTTTYTAGQQIGAATHKLTTAEMPSHTHVQNSHNHTQNPHTHYIFSGPAGGPHPTIQQNGNNGAAYGPVQTVTATNNPATATNQNTGGDGAHNNIQPSTVVGGYVIKY